MLHWLNPFLRDYDKKEDRKIDIFWLLKHSLIFFPPREVLTHFWSPSIVSLSSFASFAILLISTMKSPPPTTNLTISLLDMEQQAMSMSARWFAETQTSPVSGAETLPKRDAASQRLFLLRILQEALDLIDEDGICDEHVR